MQKSFLTCALLLAACGPAMDVTIADGKSPLTLSGNDVILEVTFNALPEEGLMLQSVTVSVGERSADVTCLKADRSHLTHVHTGETILCLEHDELIAPEDNGKFGEVVMVLGGESTNDVSPPQNGYVLRTRGELYEARGLWRIER